MPNDSTDGGENNRAVERGEGGAMINVNVKSLCGDDFEMAIPRDILVSDLKTRVRERTEVEEGRQRLIYRGRLLVDSERLSTYKVEDGHCLHMVARPTGTYVAPGGSSNAGAASLSGAGVPSPGTDNANQVNNGETGGNNATGQADTLGQRLLMGMGVPMGQGSQTRAGGTGNPGAGAAAGVDTALLNAAAGLDGGQFLSNVLGLAGAGGGGATGTAASMWNGTEGRAARAQGRESAGGASGGSAAGVRAGGAAATASGDEGDEEGQADLEHVRQGLLTLHTLLSSTSNRRRRGARARVGAVGASAAGASSRRFDSSIFPTSSPSMACIPRSEGTAGDTSGAVSTDEQEFAGKGASVMSPAVVEMGGASRSIREGEQSGEGVSPATQTSATAACEAESTMAENGLEHSSSAEDGLSLSSSSRPAASSMDKSEVVNDVETQRRQEAVVAGERGEGEFGEVVSSSDPSAARTSPVAQRWPFVRTIGHGAERPMVSGSGRDTVSTSSGSQGGLLSSSGESSAGSEDDLRGASLLSIRGLDAGVDSDEVDNRSGREGMAGEEEEEEDEEEEEEKDQETSSPDRAIATRQFYVGQWLDVKDTVNNWLEATVMDMADSGTRLKIHYNGWPPRWDEWLSWDSPRIAPFRTRTQHLPHSQHVSPAPVSAVRNAPITGMDDVRVVMPEVNRVVQDIAPMVHELSALYARDLENDTSSMPAGERALSHTLPWSRQRVQQSLRAADGSNNVASAADGDAADGISPKTAELAADVAPLLDRLGRMLTDVAPHLARLGNRRSNQAPVDVSSGANSQDAEESGELHREASLRRPAVQSGRVRRVRGPTPSRRVRSRSPEERTEAAFRQLVSTSSPPPTSSNINIHIHAIVPLRAPPSPPPPPPPPPTAAASAVATPTRADRPPLAVAGSRNQPWGGGMDAVGASASILAAARAAAASRAVRESDTPEGSTPRSLVRGIVADSPRSGGRTGVAAGDDEVSTISAGTPSGTGISRSASVGSSASFDASGAGTPIIGGTVEERTEPATRGVPTTESLMVAHGESVGPRSSMISSGVVATAASSGDPDAFASGSDQGLGSDGSASSHGGQGQRRPGGWRSIFRTFGVGGNGNSRVGGRREAGDGDVPP